jgi:hypothetical protein
MTFPELTQTLERLGSLGLLGIVVWLGFRFLDKHGTSFSNTLAKIQETLIQHMKEDAERHQRLIETIGSAEKISTEDVKRDVDKLRTDLSEGLKELRQYREMVRRMSPQPMPAVRDQRKEPP